MNSQKVIIYLPISTQLLYWYKKWALFGRLFSKYHIISCGRCFQFWCNDNFQFLFVANTLIIIKIHILFPLTVKMLKCHINSNMLLKGKLLSKFSFQKYPLLQSPPGHLMTLLRSRNETSMDFITGLEHCYLFVIITVNTR